MTHKQAMDDFYALEEIAELDDQVEYMAELHYLMQDPCKSRAKQMYERMIEAWFFEHGLIDGSEEILERHQALDASLKYNTKTQKGA